MKVSTKIPFLLFSFLFLSTSLPSFAEDNTLNMLPPQQDHHGGQWQERHQGFQNLTQEQRQARRTEMRDKFQNMSPEERQAKRAHLKERFQNMSPEQRQAFRDKRRERFQKMSPEQRQAFRERREQRRAQFRERHSPSQANQQ
jgi:Spy/CpxP family protein refolding chaperone